MKSVARAAGWTLFQAVLYLAVSELEKATWAAVYGWHNELGRGILWWYAFLFFVGLALVANVTLGSRRFGSRLPKRLAVWSAALLPLALFTLPSLSSGPVAVALIYVSVAAAVASREWFGRLASPPRSLASG